MLKRGNFLFEGGNLIEPIDLHFDFMRFSIKPKRLWSRFRKGNVRPLSLR